MQISRASLKKNPIIKRILEVGFIKKLRSVRANVRGWVKYRNIYYPQWRIARNGMVAYLSNAKVACTSIMASLVGEADIKDSYEPQKRIWELGLSKGELQEPGKYYKFTFVRNPFARLVSCYESKYHYDIEFHHKERERMSYHRYLFGYLRKDEGFEKFIGKISRIPYGLMDPHFRLQRYLVYDRRERCRVDYIGKFETLEEEFSIIQKKYNLMPLPHFNKAPLEKGKKNWMDYYTFETARIVWRKYKKDFETFGYEDEYRKLMLYLKNRSR